MLWSLVVKKIILGVAVMMLIGTSCGMADTSKQKVTLKGNGTLVYNVLPSKVDKFADMLLEGKFYGRVRSNNFYFDWKREYEGSVLKRKDNHSGALGGSVVYKSAEYKGFSAEAGLYLSEAYDHMGIDDLAYVKAGKEVYSRYNAKNGGNFELFSLAVANIDYKYLKTDLRLGRQILETFLTKSNDIKMVPNTFEGAVLTTKDIPKSKLVLAYLTRQKLKDHTRFHDVITFKNSEGEKWGNNDDPAIHKGLSYQNLSKAGKKTDNALVVAEFKNSSVKNMKLMLNYTAVPSLISSATAEISYKIPIGSISITPAIRYMQQFDNGAGKIGGASLSGKVNNSSANGYKDPDSLDSYMIAAKIDMKVAKAIKLKFGYSAIADKADLVTPWRGFQQLDIQR